MKNCDEMVNSLLQRREQFVLEQKRKKKRLTRTVTSMCCFCLVALLSLSLWQSGAFSSPPNQTLGNPSHPGVTDSLTESKNESAADNTIIVHRISVPSSVKQNICLLTDDFVTLTKEELNEYYGLNVFPAVPDDIKEWTDQRFGIYRRNGGTGDIYWDATISNYSNEDFSRSVNIEVDKGFLPLSCCLFPEPAQEKSMINNTEVTIGQDVNGVYYAQFMYHNVGFQLIAEGLSQDEFVAVIGSLIQ